VVDRWPKAQRCLVAWRTKKENPDPTENTTKKLWKNCGRNILNQLGRWFMACPAIPKNIPVIHSDLFRLRTGAGFRNHQKTSSRDGGVLSEVEKSMADVVAGRPVITG